VAAIKIIGSSGQIALGKELAGRHVLVDQVEPGVWLIKLGEFVPDSERWLFQAGLAADLDEAIGWAESNPPSESDLDTLENEVRGL
jgi:hypothetical protein